MLRGWLSEEQTSELLAMQEEDDVSLHGVMLAAGLVAVARVIQEGNITSTTTNTKGEQPPSQTLHLRATNEANLRQYCPSAPKQGCLTTYYESDHTVPPITDRGDFWRFAHDLTVKHNAAKGAAREPLKALRVYNKMFSLGGGANDDFLKDTTIRNEMGTAVYGDLGGLYRRELLSTATNKDDGE